MEALNVLFRHANNSGLFISLRAPAIKLWLSLFTDDLMIFLRPEVRDIRMARSILELFAGASGLHTNLTKCQFTPIRCTEEQIAQVLQWFPCQLLVNFLCRYLGVPLSIYKLKKNDFAPLVDVVADRLPVWKSKLTSKAGRTTLTKGDPHCYSHSRVNCSGGVTMDI
jgi:hypothetical protein